MNAKQDDKNPVQLEEPTNNFHKDPVQSEQSKAAPDKESGNQQRIKPWSVDRKRLRMENLDRLATDIMANEALKIINEAYEYEFECQKKQT